MKISARLRKQAALLLQLAASNDLIWGTASAAYHLGLIPRDDPASTHPILPLLVAAFEEAGRHACSRNEYGTQNWRAQIAEAEAMLRNGWTP